MSKIEAIGKGFIRVGDSLINLNYYKGVDKDTFGVDEDPDGACYGITLTPTVPSQESIDNGVDGSFFIATYQEDELNDFEADFETIISVLRD